MSTTSKAIACALSLLCATRPAAAAPAEPTTVEAALATGDLGAARSVAESARKAEPSAAHWQQEAEVCTRLADYACARAAWRGHLKSLPEGADRKPAEAALADLEDMSRGTVEDEPASTHRAALDKARANKQSPAGAAPAPKTKSDTPTPPKRERMVKKWYFWVTILAIAGAAGAITGIAVQAARDERPDDLDKRLALPPQLPGFRF